MEIIILLLFFVIGLFVINFVRLLQQQNLNMLTKSTLYLKMIEKLHSDKNFKRIEDILENTDSIDIGPILEEEKIAFEEYLKYFDGIILMKIPDRFSHIEADYLFKRPGELLKKHLFVRNYISNHNYKHLESNLLATGQKPLNG